MVGDGTWSIGEEPARLVLLRRQTPRLSRIDDGTSRRRYRRCRRRSQTYSRVKIAPDTEVCQNRGSRKIPANVSIVLASGAFFDGHICSISSVLFLPVGHASAPPFLGARKISFFQSRSISCMQSSVRFH